MKPRVESDHCLQYCVSHFVRKVNGQNFRTVFTLVCSYLFQKALQECETEWSQNKKVVDISQKDIRHAVSIKLS